MWSKNRIHHINSHTYLCTHTHAILYAKEENSLEGTQLYNMLLRLPAICFCYINPVFLLYLITGMLSSNFLTNIYFFSYLNTCFLVFLQPSSICNTERTIPSHMHSSMLSSVPYPSAVMASEL